MYLLKAVLIMIWFGCIPFCIGLLFTQRMKENKDSFLLTLLCGYAGMFALFELLSLPMIFLSLPFHVLRNTYGIGIFLLTVLAIAGYRKRFMPLTIGKIWQWRQIPWSGYLACLLIVVQLGIYLAGMSTDLDDSFYIGTATTTLHTDRMFLYSAYTGEFSGTLPVRYVLSPFPILLAFYGEMVQMNPTAIAHTVMPVFFLTLAYATYVLLGKRLFKGDRKAIGIFLSFLSLIHMFSYYSSYTQGTFMLIRIWQGKAVLAALLLPFLFYWGICIFEEEAEGSKWMVLLCIITSCCLVSSMGIMLAPIMLGILALLLGILKKQWKKTLLAMTCCLPSMVCAGIHILIR